MEKQEDKKEKSEVFGFNERIQILVNEFADGNNSLFASKINTGESVIRGYIAGRNLPNLEMFAKIVRIFKISTDWLLYGIGEMKKNVPGNVPENVPESELLMEILSGRASDNIVMKYLIEQNKGKDAKIEIKEQEIRDLLTLILNSSLQTNEILQQHIKEVAPIKSTARE